MKASVKIIFLALFFAQPLFLKAQGEQLFKAKCNTCHLLEKNSTGPNLKGVKQKWTDAGEEELLYEWVKNPSGLIASGKSKMAAAIKDFSKTEMSPQTVTKEEVDAILSFIDSYTPPVEIQTPGGASDTAVSYVPDYEDNLQLFYLLLVGIFIQIVAIILITNSIITLVKSDYFQKKISENGKNNSFTNVLIAVFTFGLMAYFNQSYAMEFVSPGESKEPSMWLLVENSDLYFMLVINLILLGIIFYLKNMFKNLLSMVKSEEKKVTEVPALKKINRILTDAVPIEEESRIMLHHEYDGIRELDNNLPPWWVWGFVATIVFAVVYLINYHVLKVSDLQITAYEKDMKKSEREVKSYLAKMAMNVDETNATLLTESDDLASGKSIFQINCVTCHNPKGEGNIGPNLTDKSWIYGYDIKELFKTVKTGTPNGMPEHNSKLNPVQIQQVASYVLQLPEVNGKAAEGTIIEK